jgi:hypothetical protein
LAEACKDERPRPEGWLKTISSSDVCEYVRDLNDRWRHVDELQKEMKSIPDDSPLHQVLLDEYAEALADVYYREDDLEARVENGEIPASLIATLKRRTSIG